MSLAARFENSLSFLERCFSVRNVFLFGSMLSVVTFTILFYRGVLPLSIEYFLFYSLVLFLACLARPSWMFLLFMALLPLEIVTVTPPNIGVDLRPYQWVGGLLGMAVGIRFLARRLPSSLFRWHSVDTFLSIMVGGMVLSGLVSQGLATKQTFVVISFLFLYFLSRLFLKNWHDVRLAFLFFFGSGGLVLLWGIGQNILFLLGYSEFSIMPGRPNGTLIEPDWLGLFSLFLLAPILWWLKERLTREISWREVFLPWFFLVLVSTVLILTVSRSAWLGATVLTVIFFLLAFYEKGKGLAFRGALLMMEYLIVAFGLALLLVVTVPLTRFALIDRAGSTVSQMQTITIACDGTTLPPKEIQTTDELTQYGCQHILLEEKAARQAEGKLVTTTERPDPNVDIRKMIFRTAWDEIKVQPLLGIGWGNIGPKLGIDERGASYNASNLFLELWLGGGLIAIVAWVGFLLWVGYRFFQWGWKETGNSSLQPLLLSLLFGFLVFNLFNTGLLLGFVWVWFALFPLFFSKPTDTTSV